MRMTSGYMAVLFLLTANVLAAQKVLYSPAIMIASPIALK